MSRKKTWPAIARLGIVESLHKEKAKKWKSNNKETLGEILLQSDSDARTHPKTHVLKLVILCIFLIFLGRLFYLTIVQGERNRDLAEENRIRLVEIEAVRGKILDKEGRILAQSERTYTLKRGSQILKITQEQAAELERLSLASENFEGELGRIFQEVKRQYLLGEATAHILGYVSAVQEDDLSNDVNRAAFGKIGRLGLEATYDQFLNGQNGKRLIEVDAAGKKVSIIGTEAGENGNDLYLTVDGRLQEIAYQILKKHADQAGSKRGAIVIQNPDTGAVLALVSLPSFNPNQVAEYLESEDKPFLNRAVAGIYPPGSIFKIVSALAGLESGKITKDTQVEDTGEFFLGDDRFVNWYFQAYGAKDGLIKIDRAIARSNDIFFYRLAEKIGLDSLRKMAIKLGFGQKTSIDLPNESFGLVPDEKWKKAAHGSSWYLGDTLHLGIGQGFMLATPIQINSLISFTANGKLTKPYLVSKISNKKGSDVALKGKISAENLLNDQNLAIVRAGMKQACEKDGTGWPFFSAPYKVGCKTGTAEQALGNPHAWFSAFAPFENPEISITVIIEDGGEGSSVAAPVAREVLDWWFRNKVKS